MQMNSLLKRLFAGNSPRFSFLTVSLYGTRETKKNQRTNGPVNAHLRPEIYTCTNKVVRLEWYNACI